MNFSRGMEKRRESRRVIYMFDSKEYREEEREFMFGSYKNGKIF